MSCAIEFLPPVFFVRWRVPEIADIARIDASLKRAHESLGRPVYFVAIVPEDCRPPDDRMRQAFTDTMNEVLNHCRSMHFVMEGEGFKHSILRSALVTVLLVRGQRNRIFVHRTLAEALVTANRQADPKEKFEISVITKKADAANLLTKPLTGPRPSTPT